MDSRGTQQPGIEYPRNDLTPLEKLLSLYRECPELQQPLLGAMISLLRQQGRVSVREYVAARLILEETREDPSD